MRVMRGHKVSEAFWAIEQKHVQTRGWWLGIRHGCWCGRVFKPLLRVFFVDERQFVVRMTHKQREAILTTACRHCHQQFYVHVHGPEYKAMRTEAETLARMGISQVQYVDSSTTLTPLGVVAGKRARRPVR